MLAQDQTSFNQDIRPLLSEYCFACHGPDSEHRAADLRLDIREAAIDYGAFVPGAPDESLVVERITSEDPDLRMPPGDHGKQLTREQQSLLTRWIKEGAVYEKHWAFQPIPAQVELPSVDGDWARRDMDSFVARRLQERGLKSAVEAERSVWLRRVSLDLTGLPPTLKQREEFLADDSAEAYDKVVDRLLNSPQYAERMATMWMDVARYADTFGYQNDVEMNVWPWRDWVIQAFTENLPYDQFIVQQLAGDRLPNATPETRLATTFNRLHRQTNEGGSVPEEFRLTGIADRTTTMGTAFLGLTLECCRCHDHKFDPMSQREFYQLSAFFADIDELGLYSHFTQAVPTPSLLLYQDGQELEHQHLLQNRADAEKHYHTVQQQVLLEWADKDVSGEVDQSITAKPVFEMALNGDQSGVVDAATLFDGDQAVVCQDAPRFGRTDAFSYSLWIKPAALASPMVVLHQSRAAEDSGFRGLQLLLRDGHPEFSMIHFWPGNAVRVQSRTAVPAGHWTHLAVTHDGTGTAAGLAIYVDGERTDLEVVRDHLTYDIRHRREWGDSEVGSIPLALGARFRDVGFRDGCMDQLRVFDRRLTEVEVLAESRLAETQWTAKQPTDRLRNHYAAHDERVAKAREQLRQACDLENEFVSKVRQIMTMEHFEDAPATHLLVRGDYTQPAEVVMPVTPEVWRGQVGRGDRLALANWIVDDGNPLTARVMANRMWHLFWGRGLVSTLEDFGNQGAPPSHPQLLDYLARGLIDHQWDLHWLCREIVLSSAYRQSSLPVDSATYETDPENVWLARGPKHRLSAEQLRDLVLFTSGLLVPTVGGPSVKPYQPPGLWQESGTGKTYVMSEGAGLYRRSLYTFWKRTAPPPNMLTLDATSRESCTPKRELTTTPLQAMVFLNDPQFVEAARVLAENVLRENSDWDAQVEQLFLKVLSRPPKDAERQILREGYEQQLEYFQANPQPCQAFLQTGTRPVDVQLPAAELAAFAVVVQTVFAYDETIMSR